MILYLCFIRGPCIVLLVIKNTLYSSFRNKNYGCIAFLGIRKTGV